MELSIGMFSDHWTVVHVNLPTLTSNIKVLIHLNDEQSTEGC